MKLTEMLKPEYMKIGLNGKTKDNVMQELADFVGNVHNLDRKDVYTAFVEREKKGSTGVGNGLAIPHGRSERIDGMYMIVAYDATGKEFDTYDQNPAHLFFAAVASEDFSPHEQLEALRIIAEMYEKTDIAKAVQKISNPADLYKLLVRKEEEIS